MLELLILLGIIALIIHLSEYLAKAMGCLFLIIITLAAIGIIISL
jgi:hypothetical protein